MLLKIQSLAVNFSELAWGPWLLVLLLGGGFYLLIRSRLVPFRYLGHAVDLVRGKVPDPGAQGPISPFQALAAALAGTIGLGNIAGVAIAITLGGPGTIFWMWVTAIFGIATKFFTCTLAVMYRSTDAQGRVAGGPMYVITQGLPKAWHPLAYFFAAVGLVGCLPAFQTNQLVAILRESVFIPVLVQQDLWQPSTNPLWLNLTLGCVLALVTAYVTRGGIARIAQVAGALVPFMALLYLGCAATALALNAEQIPGMLGLIIEDAFSGRAVAGGSLLAVMLTGVKRGAFSNEAGIGTEALAHGVARTSEPVREGLVAMLGPIIDTLLVCTATALIILLAGNWQASSFGGIALTVDAFRALLGTPGVVILFACVLCFATTTIFTYAFYGGQCAVFLLGESARAYYRYLYIGFILVAGIISLETAVGLIDGCYALMAIPTMLSTLLLAPKVVAQSKQYFERRLRLRSV